MRSRRSSAAASSALSLKSEERSNGGVEGPDALNKLLIRHMIRLVDVDVQILGQDRGDDLEISIRLRLADLPDGGRAVRLPVRKHVLKERFAQLVSRTLRTTAADIAG